MTEKVTPVGDGGASTSVPEERLTPRTRGSDPQDPHFAVGFHDVKLTTDASATKGR
jgi:hypothetical protein